MMITTSFRRPFSIMLRDLMRPMIPILAYILVVSWLDIQFHLEDYNFPITLVAVLGTVIGLVLAFRTNSSYGRWWEARTIWGAIVNDSRSWTRQLLEFVPASAANEEVVRRLTNGHELQRGRLAPRRRLDKSGGTAQLTCVPVEVHAG